MHMIYVLLHGPKIPCGEDKDFDSTFILYNVLLLVLFVQILILFLKIYFFYFYYFISYLKAFDAWPGPSIPAVSFSENISSITSLYLLFKILFFLLVQSLTF